MRESLSHGPSHKIKPILKTENSDIDLMVELSKPIGWNFFVLEEYLEQLFNRKIDLVTKKALKEQIKQSILNQMIYF